MIASFRHDVLSVVVTMFCTILITDQHFGKLNQHHQYPTIGKIRIVNLMLLKNGYCSMSYDTLYPSNCKTINKCDSEIWSNTMIVSKSFQMIAKQIQFWYGLQHFQKPKLWKALRMWGLQNAFGPGLTSKSATLSCILNACTEIWIVAHFLHDLPNFKTNNNQLIVNVITIRNWFFL